MNCVTALSLDKPLELAIDWTDSTAVPVADPYLANWLMDTGSLTERLQSMCRQFNVQVLYHAQPVSSGDYVREVILWGDKQPWVYARSVIPVAINNGELLDLGTQPLGQRIFNDERFVRGNFELCQLDCESLGAGLPNELVSAFTDGMTALYGRRSMFQFLDTQMSVAEVFLPAAPAYIHQHKDSHG
ncbi:chorismate lyase [Alteromonas sp. ASW11-36]|uniref:Probable chorismate pyruvate-lyase n=1 Tax=Alteromonas arenosi TaxID=3055817 RepID=A0ABT7SUN0_9ALTE|nr:chorismate lyase [Alteromonas sp. ASW11-36]MDM7859262.1 chorismate lyase [Alteromonas sp. ASW11-36]